MDSSRFGYWSHSSLLTPFDVAIIGGGFTGLCAGITLLQQKPKLRVTILESELIGTRASSRNAGFVCFGSPSELKRDIENHGLDEVLTLLRLKLKGVKVLTQYVKTRKSSFHRAPAYELLLKDFPEARDKSLDAMESLNKVFQTAIGVADYYSLNKTLALQYNVPGLQHVINLKYEAQVNPAQLVESLTMLFRNLGGIYLNGCEAISYEKNKDTIAIQSSFGTFKTTQMLIASNAFAPQLQPRSTIQPHRAQVLITSPLPKMPFKGNYHLNFGYLYFRNVDRNRLLFGGARNIDANMEQTAKLGLNDEIQAWLISFLKTTLLPDVPHSVEAQWSGIMGFGKTLLPIQEEIEDNVFLAAGMNGMGTALGPALGYDIAMHILKKRDGNFKKTQPKTKIPF